MTRGEFLSKVLFDISYLIKLNNVFHLFVSAVHCVFNLYSDVIITLKFNDSVKELLNFKV